ncbi:hypothetical protein MPTK1_2g20250 [Marchantia polymorpha subsp. ruderalis]|uniref:Uncharacterized protein n=1 Tax=Marchantia polymorpha TaxID=3197 RepID=A0A2R6WV59_MARPO|nr:hypothetical protein MARPO_0055s0024 [Marchantia polymorpha]BBN03043.1 hypothetical protein Mp_2g20250 [Marchantia polymorpha subsp. ruderalis]PTQ37740.1 hypothetical protein MARPO_0055s0024 [Marchantia polymorpha]PTQ37741.1 hypothetical protein MARPO_0055s0024 [Marchantia polymorpha]PTQ37742.1 hypothetical protein MARPO_0055s0024 [Marchantia polymorpha]|eukprot:PTQ37739.1 hypothetical protein MARPO_0055s0024 [Marchantia polymorpha]
MQHHGKCPDMQSLKSRTEDFGDNTASTTVGTSLLNHACLLQVTIDLTDSAEKNTFHSKHESLFRKMRARQLFVGNQISATSVKLNENLTIRLLYRYSKTLARKSIRYRGWHHIHGQCCL